MATVQREPRVVHFEGGAFTMGQPLLDSLTLDTPGADAMVGIVTSAEFIDHSSFGPFFRVDADDTYGTSGVANGEPLRTTCPCDRETEPTCRCLPRFNGSEATLLHETRASPNGRALSVVFADMADGVQRYWWRRLELPFTRSPVRGAFPSPRARARLDSPHV